MAKTNKAPEESPAAEAPQAPAGADRSYWIGVYRGFRYSTVTVGGIAFQHHTQLTVEDGNGEGKFRLGDKRLGQVVKLDKAKVKEIGEKVSKMVVVWPRTIGEGECLIRKTTLKGYRSNPNHEEPLGKYLYMVPVEDPEGFNRTKEPAPLSATA